MHKTSYNPELAPDPGAWLCIPEDQRLRSVTMFHMVHREKSGNQKAHAALHVAVENQIATGFGPTVRAMTRLQSEGLSRHDSIHAIATVIAEHLYAQMQAQDKQEASAFQSGVNQDIEELSASVWREKHGKT
jgi:Domain of unknown function (DUF1841)